MVHLRVVLNPIEPPPLVGDGHVGAGIGMGHQSKALGHLCHIVPVAHPGDAAVGQVPEETAVRIVVGHGFSVLPGGIGLGGGDLPAQGLGHELAAVADTQHGHAQRKNSRIHMGRFFVVDTVGAAGKDKSDGVLCLERVQRRGIGLDLTVHPALTHPAGDQLIVLTAEIQNDDQLVFHLFCS